FRSRIVRVSGPKGNIEKSFKKSPVHISIEDNKIRIEVRWKGKRGYALLNTIKGIIKNMFIGVTKGYIYKLKAYYIHFPMDVYVDDSYLIIKNFVGERGIRRARIVDGVKVEVVKKGGDIDIIVKGIDKEAVGQTAANIMNATKVKSKDPRVFLDGIYLYDKGVENG
ncbi:TPA: 50S ribosomal protein L6, partial [Candidatus Geothermarchaeota archaeon]|nr:50S ribosomal protein L6 [Candidatus Geothermarchaeota archaeon]